MRKLLIISALLILQVSTMWAQILPDYRMQVGFSAGYRLMDMNEMNYTFANIGYNYHRHGDRSDADVLMTGTKPKPYNKNLVISGYLVGRPLKNKAFTIKLQYDYLPDAIRNETIRYTEIDSYANNPILKDTVKDIINSRSKMTIQSAAVLLGYDINYQKYIFNFATGISYNSFRVTSDYSQVEYAHGYSFPITQWPPGKYVWEHGTGFGLQFQLSAGYKFSSQWSAHVEITAHAEDVEVYDLWGRKEIWYERKYGNPEIGYLTFDQYLSAQLSGFQIGGGLSFRIF